jgi:cytochrome c oxidase subunit 1
MNRRMYDGGAQYAYNAGLPLKLNVVIGMAAWTLGLFQLPFIYNFFSSIFWGKTVDKNPWERPRSSGRRRRRRDTELPHEPIVYRAPYEYSVPGAAKDFSPQFEPEKA